MVEAMLDLGLVLVLAITTSDIVKLIVNINVLKINLYVPIT